MRQHLKPHIRITEEVLRAMLDQHKAVTNERDALAAHVERLTHQIEGALRIKELWLPANCEPEHEGECQALGRMCAGFTNALAEKPDTTSLARHDSHPDCELECGAYGTYCKCAAEAQQ